MIMVMLLKLRIALILGTILLVSGLLYKSVSADEFYEYRGDNNDGYGVRGSFSHCAVAGKLPHGYSSLPDNCTNGGCVSYDAADVAGHTTTDLMVYNYSTIDSLGASAREIAVPPNTPVNFVAMLHNGAGHEVDIRALRVNLSEYFRIEGVYAHHPEVGNMLRIGAAGSLLTTPILAVYDMEPDGDLDWNYRDFTSFQTDFINAKTLAVDEYTAAEVAYTFTTIQPVQLVNASSGVTYTKLGNLATITYTIVVKNVSSYTLSNISVSMTSPFGIDDFDAGSTFIPNQEKTFTKTVTNHVLQNGINSLDAVVAMTDPNSHTESAGIVSMFIDRNDADAGDPGHDSSPDDWFGWQPTDQVHGWDNPNLEQSSNKITLLPYVGYASVLGSITYQAPSGTPIPTPNPTATATPTVTPSLLAQILPRTGNPLLTFTLLAFIIGFVGLSYKLLIARD